MKKKLCILMAALILTLAGCGSQAPNPTQAPTSDPAGNTSFEAPSPEPSGIGQETTAPQDEWDIPLSSEKPNSTPDVTVPDGETLTVTYLDVGQGDAALLECAGEYMLIDGGETSASSTMYTVLKNKGIDYIDTLVITHAHSDHAGGIAGALNYAKVGTAFCPVTEYDSKAFGNVVKYLGEQGVSITVPEAGETFTLGSAQVTILGPLMEYEETNDTSIVLRVDYGETSFLFTGDMEQPAEKDLINTGSYLEADVLKVGHHGSSTSTGYQFLREVAPSYAVISCGEGNSYGHPHDETMSKFRDADVTVYRTDLQGDIICTSDGTTLTWATDKAASDAALNPTIADGSGQNSSDTVGTYIGNINSHIFHSPTCSTLPKESNQIQFSSREEAVTAGYKSCGRCHP